MKENMCGSVNTRCLQSIASKCSVYQTNFNFFDQTKIMSTSCSRHAHAPFALVVEKGVPYGHFSPLLLYLHQLQHRYYSSSIFM